MSIFKGIRGFASGKRGAEQEQKNTDTQSVSDNAWEQTLNRWQKVSRLNQNDINAKVQIILSHFNLGHVEKSNQLIEDLNRDHPDDQFVKLASARHAQRVEDYSLATTRWSALHDQNPEMTEPLLSMASMKVAEGDYEGAFELTNRVKELDPQEGLASIIQGRIHHRNENWVKALECWDAAISLSGSSFEADLQRATALTKLGRYEEVLDSADNSIAQYELKVPFMLMKVKALTLSKQDRESIKICDKVLTIKPDSTNAAHAKAYAYYRLGVYADAETACDYALSLDENDVQMLTLSARIAQSLAKKVA